MECYLAFKGNEILTHTTICPKLEKHAKWNKPDTKGQSLHNSIHMKSPNRQIHGNRNIQWLLGVKGESWCQCEWGFSFGWWKCSEISGDGCVTLPPWFSHSKKKWKTHILPSHILFLFPFLLTFLNFLIPFTANLEIISDSPWLSYFLFYSLIYYNLASDCAILNKVTNDFIIFQIQSLIFNFSLLWAFASIIEHSFLKVASGFTLSWLSFGFWFHLILDLALWLSP